jgi:UDP:flavonoid glycosyltransferase YjiC (YdhE family)
MKRVLFVIIPEKGHIHPYIGPAAHLRRRGHTVAFYAVHDISAPLRRAGFELFFPGQPDCPPPPDINRGRFFAEKIRDRDWLRGWIRELLVERVPDQVEPLRAIVRQFRPDVLAIDPMVYQGAIVAAQESLPWAGLSSSLNPVVPDSFTSELLDTNDWLAADRDALFARYGLRGRFRVCDCLSPYLNLVFSTEELVGPAPLDVRLVGPSLPPDARGDECDFPWERLRQEYPVIYMSLGSQIYYQPALLRTAMRAVAGRPVQLVLSVSELLQTGELGPLPDNVLAVRYVPQLQLLRCSAAFITHGGANSLMEALALGVPLLISPLCNDQFHNARFITQSGVGLELDMATATPDECWRALAALLGPGRYRQNVARVQASYQRHDGAATAARLVEELAG